MKFIVVTPGYDDNAGGTVVLHQLCDRLNRLGFEAYIWPITRPLWDWKSPFKSLQRFGRFIRKRIKYGYRLNPKLQTPMASVQDIQDAVIIYPEVVVGNPLQSARVVRWLLHKPGFNNRGKIEFGQDDLFFYYDKAFDDSRYNKHPDNRLHIVSTRSDVYKQTNESEREGSCYLLRKGDKRARVHDTSSSILIDGLSHEETAKIFNQVKYCYSYDTYTMYNVYAAMCGCIPVVIPEEGVSKEQWQPDEANRYGMAYGMDDIEYAVKTRPLLLAHLTKQEEESDMSVLTFVKKCQSYFSL